MGYTTRIEWEILRSIDSATLTGSYQSLGTPLIHPSYKCKIVNNSTSLITISNDGINSKDVVPASSFFLYDEGSVGQSGSFPALPEGTQISVSGSAGTGLIYLVSQYIVTV